MITIMFFLSFEEKTSSEEYFDKNDYHYKIVTFDSAPTQKRIEYYRSLDKISKEPETGNVKWIKDSTWLYLSKNGDTIKRIKYANGMIAK